jgi:hypothetical protein
VNGKWSHLTRRPTTPGSTVLLTTMASGNAGEVAESCVEKMPVVSAAVARDGGSGGAELCWASGFDQSDDERIAVKSPLAGLRGTGGAGSELGDTDTATTGGCARDG